MSLPMLFICIELKIYVPDGLGDLMDALSDPRAFLSNQEKRLRQMKAMGVEEMDLLASTGGESDSLALTAPFTSLGASSQVEEEAWRMEEISVESLQQQKKFLKLRKTQLKKLKQLQKAHEKERTDLQKQQCVAIEKLLSKQANCSGWNGCVGGSSIPSTSSIAGGSNSLGSECSANGLSVASVIFNNNLGDVPVESTNEKRVESMHLRELINMQIRAWSSLVERHKKAELELLRKQLIEQGK